MLMLLEMKRVKCLVGKQGLCGKNSLGVSG